MPATIQLLERRIARLERDVQAARGIGAKAVLRGVLNHGGHQSENMAAPASGADAVSKDSISVALPDVGATGTYTTADITVDSKGRVTTAATGAGIDEDAVEDYARRFGLMVIIGAVTGG